MTAWERGHRLPLVAEIPLAAAAGAGTFALAAVALDGVNSGVVVALLGVVFIVTVVAIARFAGIAYAVPVAMAGMLAYDWFYLPPTHPFAFPDVANLVDLVVYLGVGVLLGELAAHAARRAEAAERARRQIAEEQAALRRVATLVARGAPADEIFAAVAAEAGRLLDVHGIRIARYEDETELVHVAEWSKAGYDLPAYDRAELEGTTSVSAEVLRTGRAARIDNYEDIVVRAAFARGLNAKSVVGAPVVVEGRLWGVMISWSGSGPLPPDMEGRLTEFAELVATAISNTDARTGMARLASEQAALRRVATLVAKAVPTAAVFEAVTREVGLQCGADLARMERFELDHTVTAIAAWSSGGEAQLAVGKRFALEGESIAAQVLATGRPARLDTFIGTSGPIAREAQALGIRASIGCPIVVGRRTWGLIAASRRDAPFPPNTESRIADFTELVATAVANAEARADLLASRARLLTAGDDARRRVVRDLHDGAQQSLVQVIITLRLIEHALRDDDMAVEPLVGEALDQAEQANAELRELARGILPAILAGGGLAAGVRALVSRLRLPVDVDVPRDRFPPEIEASAYFVVAEALTNVAKHADARSANVTARVDDGVLRVHVWDDGVGGARADGSGLLGLNDRVAAMGGRLEIESPPGDGTRIAATLPLQPSRTP